MVVNFEFLDNEPIENIITAQNFCIDKTYFFGYEQSIEQFNKSTKDYLMRVCGVKQVEFVALPVNNLNGMLGIMRTAIKNELEAGNDIFFDITGGAGIILLAFGILSKEFDAPMHMYDIEHNRLLLLNDFDKNITKVAKQEIKLNIEEFVKLKNAVINKSASFDERLLKDLEFLEDMNHMWEVVSRHREIWNKFTDKIRKCANVQGRDATIAISATNEVGAFYGILGELQKAGVITNLSKSKVLYRFHYRNDNILQAIAKTGVILESHVYSELAGSNDDCKQGVLIDWDGVIHTSPSDDVSNEIDVLVMYENVPTFVSCKSGSMNAAQALHALYELQTLAKRFGGKYVKLVLAVAQEPSDTARMRAQEMGIEIWEVE